MKTFLKGLIKKNIMIKIKRLAILVFLFMSHLGLSQNLSTFSIDDNSAKENSNIELLNIGLEENIAITNGFNSKPISDKVSNSNPENAVSANYTVAGSKAQFSISPAKGCNGPQMFSFTDETIGVTDWFWDFADGNTSSLQNPTHSFASNGTYLVALVPNGNTNDSTHIYLPISNLVAEIEGSSKFGCAPLTVNFSNDSHNDGPGVINSYLWDFGDGNTSTLYEPNHVYDQPGIYTVKLTVTSSLGCTSTETKSNFVQTIGPNVNFEPNTTLIEACSNSLEVAFTDLTTFGAPIIARNWNFGDGGSSNIQNPTHTFNGVGIYDVSLKVSDIDGCNRTFTIDDLVEIKEKTTTKYVVNTNDAGIGSLRDIISMACSGDTIRFDNAIDGDTIKLTSGQILIDKNLVITGNDTSKTIIDGRAASRIFEITAGNLVSISKITIQNGRANAEGGGIYNKGSLYLYETTLRNNTAFHSGIGVHGGAIFNINGLLSIINSRVTGNYAFSLANGQSNGGGIFSAGSGGETIIKNSIISGNVVENGIKGLAQGGGLYINSGIHTFINSTITGNEVVLTNSNPSLGNVNEYGGGIYINSGTTINITNTIVALNDTSKGSDLYLGNNVIFNDNGGNFVSDTTGNHPILNGNLLDPLFIENVTAAPSIGGNLQLQACSPAINAGKADTTGLDLGLLDLAGNPRVFGGRIDIGAYESDETGTHTLVSSGNPSVVGEQVTFTSTMSPSAATGSISFKEGSTVLSTQPLVAGVASFSKSDFTVGNHTITSHYSGSCPNLKPVSNEIIQEVGKGAAILALSSSKNPSTFGENVTFTANLTPAAATGTIVFKEAGLPIGSTTLSGTGVATLSIATLSAGSHNITAEYGGDANYEPASSILVTQQVDKASTEIALASDISTAAFGAAITFTATLSNSNSTGSVVFKEGTTTLGTITINSSGEAVLVLSTLAVGNHAITASYAGDANFTGNTSTAANVSIGLATTTVALAATATTSVYGTSVGFTANITPATATGNIVFKEGSSTLGTVALSAGSATFSLATLTAGNHNIIAEYGGDISYGTSSSSPLLHTVTCPTISPTISFTGTDLLNCAGGNVNRTANGAVSYVWSNGLGNNAAASISAPGTYTVTATFISGCTNTASVTIAAPIQPTLTAGLITNPTTCGGLGKITFATSNVPDGNYSLNYTGTGSPKNITLTNNAFDLTGLPSGAYSNFSMDVAGCTATSGQSKALNDPAAPTLLAGTVTHPTTCGATGSIAFSSSNLPNGNYSLSFSGLGSPKSITVNANAFTLNNLPDGTYSNFSITSLGCTGSDASSVNINDPDSPTLMPGLVTEPSICGAKGSIAFTTSNLPDGNYPLSFTGDGSPKNITVSSHAFDLTGLAAGTYSNFSVSHLGCTGTFVGSKTITNPPAASLTAGAITNPTTCSGSNGAIAFNTDLGDGSYSLNYVGSASPKIVNVSGNTFNISGLPTGNYSNFSITIPGCISSDVVTKTLEEPLILASASNNGPYNEGHKIDMNATGGTSYSWSGPNGFFSTLQNPAIPTSTPANAGVYSVTVTASNNCSATATTEIMISCSSQALNYYLVFTDGNPEIIAPLVPNLQVQASNRPMSVIAVSACEAPLIESVRLQLSGTTNLQFQIDNEMPFNLHDFYNVNVGDVLAPNYYTFIARGYDQDNSLGNVITGPDVIGFNIVGSGRSITSVSTSVSEVCVGSTFSVSAISANNTNYPYGTGNAYQVYLSDVNGDFMSRTLIGSGTNSSNISCQIPMYMPGSDKYKVMVISTSPIVTSPPSITALNVIGNDLTLKSPIDDINSSVKNHKSISAIKAENKLIGTANSAFTAGKYIELNPGFSIESNTVFEARIENNCGL